MKPALAWGAALLVGGLAASPAWADPCEGKLPPRGASFAGVVRYVGDGDGLCVGPPGHPEQWIEVRLGDYDAPELNEAGGRQARALLANTVMGRPLSCRAARRTYDRVVAQCLLGGRPLGDVLRARGGVEGGR